MALTHYGASWTKVGEYEGPVRYPGEVVAEADLAGLPDDLVGAIRDGRGALLRPHRAGGAARQAPGPGPPGSTSPSTAGSGERFPAPREPTGCAGTGTSGASSRRTASAGRTGTTRAASASSTRDRDIHVDLAQALLGEDVPLAPIPSTGLGVFQGESEVGRRPAPGGHGLRPGSGRVPRHRRRREHLGHRRRLSLRLAAGRPATSTSPPTSASSVPGRTSTGRPASWCGPPSTPTHPTSTPPSTATA